MDCSIITFLVVIVAIILYEIGIYKRMRRKIEVKKHLAGYKPNK